MEIMLEGILYTAYVALLVIAGIAAGKIRFALKHFTPPVVGSMPAADVDLPSVTVCIPARNEMHALTECLERVIDSDYQKLEIIVLDDVSGDDTITLIKSFAHEGVRFVQGKALPVGWLGKNHALQGLLDEASGSYVLYMDVDTRIAPGAVSNMVRYAMSQHATMVSVLPRREDGWRMSVLFSALRYFWEVVFHSKSFPASASSAWMIKRDVLLHKFNGFEQLKSAIQPEAELAKSLSASDQYRFLMSTEQFGVGYEKKWRSQLSTSVRLLYPLLRNSVPSAVTAVFVLLLVLTPFFVVFSSLFVPFGLVHGAGLFVIVIFMALYGLYSARVWKKGAGIGALLLPVLIAQEILLIIVSLIQYKRKSVKWKGRKILVSR